MRTWEQWQMEKRENGKLRITAIPRKIQEAQDVLAGIRGLPNGYTLSDVATRLSLLFEERDTREKNPRRYKGVEIPGHPGMWMLQELSEQEVEEHLESEDNRFQEELASELELRREGKLQR